MANYELLYIVGNQFTEAELPDVRAKVDALLTKRGAVIGYQDLMGKRKLAYPINKQMHGYYVVTEFEVEDTSVIAAITNELRLDKEILRAQIIAKTQITAEEIARDKKLKEKEREAQRQQLNQREGEEDDAPKPRKPKAPTKNLDQKLDEILTTNDVNL